MNAGGILTYGSFGNYPSPLSNDACSLAPLNSTLVTTPDGFDVTAMVTLPNQLGVYYQVYAYGENSPGGPPNWTQVGSWTSTSGSPDFSLSTPAAQTLMAGQAANVSETITPQNGFNSAVTLNWMNQGSWPAGLTASFSPNPAGTSSMIAIGAASGTPGGTYTLTFSGTGGRLSHTASVGVTVGAAPPAVVSVTPSAGTGATQTFSAVYSDSSGGSAIRYAYLLLNTSVDGTNACYLYYDSVARSFGLMNDPATGAVGTAAPLTPTPLQNSQCVFRPSISTATVSGSNLTVNFAIDFKPSFAGAKNVYLYATDTSGLATGWQQPQNATYTATDVHISGPALLEANLGFPPFDHYDTSSPGNSYVPNCPAGLSVRGCYQMLFASYAQQGVTGVRFFFQMCGSSSSTALYNCGQAQNLVALNQTWVSKVRDFMADIKAGGIASVAVAPDYDDPVGYQNAYVDTPLPPNGLTTVSLLFNLQATRPYVANPREKSTDPPYASGFPFEGTYHGTDAPPDGTPYFIPNLSYRFSPANPIFVGWDKIFQVFDAVLGTFDSASGHPLNLTEFEIVGEQNLIGFPVLARHIYDDKHGNVDVYGTVRGLVSTHGFDPGKTGFPVAASGTNVAGFQCLSLYGDSASIITQSEFTSALAGGGFGDISGATDTEKGLYCGGVLADQGVVLPNGGYPQLPKVVDIHIYPCVGGQNGCDPSQSIDALTTEASHTFSAVKAFLDSFAPTNPPGWRGYNETLYNAQFILGETHGNSTYLLNGTAVTCDGAGAPAFAPFGTVLAFDQSGLRGRTLPAGSQAWFTGPGAIPLTRVMRFR